MIDGMRLGKQPWPLSNAPERPDCTFCNGHITMDIKSILFQLRAERDAVDVAITALERLEHQHRPAPAAHLAQ